MKNIFYVRDKRSPSPKNEGVSKIMSANKAKDTEPEIIVRKELYRRKIRGFRANYKQVPGSPDIAFLSRKIAVFINGCFWHRCPFCDLDLPKTNKTFWKEKFKKNGQRDKKKTEHLQNLNWRVVTIWECQIKKELEKQVKIISDLYYE